jgi:hypothetical protein
MQTTAQKELAALIKQLRHACSVALGDLLAFGMPAQASTGKLLLEAINDAEERLSQTGALLPEGAPSVSDYTQAMRRSDWDILGALVEQQQELHQQLKALAGKLLTQAGKAHDHAAGFQHKPETCATCASHEATEAGDP